ncbi:MAG: hypothetical protein PSV26_14275 [Polaromonas sp.]|uniref:hypothetical protein n=1 Tax=Polaromonas sp. TaxID=1869339 RepID=UPI002487344D|nr:hypothetical protein [Polaromonas sp.]MDI1238644.1 hypothetical protein [Polaromonas sp.]
MNEVLDQHSHSTPSLSTFSEVWTLELADIDDRLSGNDPDSFANWLGGYSKKFENITGADANEQIGIVGMIPGVRHAAVAGAAIGMGVDLINSFDTIKQADRTQRLLALSEKPEMVPNWDTVEMLIEHIETWLLPVLNRRREVLQQVNSASGGNQTVTDRVTLYQSGIAELNAALVWLRSKQADFKQAYKARESVYVEGANRALRVYAEAKKAVNLSVNALLMDRTAGNQKLDEIERGFAALRCTQGGVLSKCENLACEGSDFCLAHSCYIQTCTMSVAKNSHYCTVHGKQLQDVTAFMPKLLAKNGLLPKEKTPKTPGENVPTGYLILGGIFIVFILIFNYAGALNSPDRAPAPVPVTSVVQPQFMNATVGTEDFAALTPVQLENRRLELEQEGELSGKKYQTLVEKIDVLRPRLKIGDRDAVVANAKEIMVTMEARLAELSAMKDVVEKLMQIYQFIEANPSKLAPGTAMATNTERLKNMQDAFQNIRQTVTDVESQNASSRSALAEVIAAR